MREERPRVYSHSIFFFPECYFSIAVYAHSGELKANIDHELLKLRRSISPEWGGVVDCELLVA